MRESCVRVNEASGASQGGPDREGTGSPAQSSLASPDAHLASRSPGSGTP